MINPKTRRVKESLIKNHTFGLALDIDETIAWTIGSWVQQMQSLFGNPEGLSISELIHKYRYTQNVPYWQTPEALAWVDNHIYDNNFQLSIQPIENSLEFIIKIQQKIPIVAYLTTRPETVKRGTAKWLKIHRFPTCPIIARPKDVPRTEGNSWKAQVLEYLYPQVQGIIDDNPNLAKVLSANYPGKVFLYDNSNVPEISPNIFACPSWKEVYSQISKQF